MLHEHSWVIEDALEALRMFSEHGEVFRLLLLKLERKNDQHYEDSRAHGAVITDTLKQRLQRLQFVCRASHGVCKLSCSCSTCTASSAFPDTDFNIPHFTGIGRRC